jgi:hypothetical protein
VAVVGPDTVGGRGAVVVQTTYQDAASLFQYLHFLGSWRPFFPQDRVDLWLDRDTWFPLRYEVFPVAGQERQLWATQMGLPAEPSSRAVFRATFRTLSTDAPAAADFVVDPGPEAVDEGFQDLPLPQSRPCGPTPPIRPCSTGELRLYRYGRFLRSDLRPYSESVLAYSQGLAWLTVTRVNSWKQDALFGIGPFPERVRLERGKGVGYYEPASSTDPRRLAIHTSRGEFLLATSLPRADLLGMAASLPITGLAQPDAWLVHRWSGGVVEQGVARASFPLLAPSFLPPGYREVAMQTARSGPSTGVAFVYRKPAAEFDGVGLILYQATGQTLPPPDSPDEQAVAVGAATGRWSPEEHLLEWMDGDVYRSVSGPSFDLATLLKVAVSLHPKEAS